MTFWFSLLDEVVQGVETARGRSVVPTEVTLGFAWQPNRFLTIEYGTQIRGDGTWPQILRLGIQLRRQRLRAARGRGCSLALPSNALLR